MQTVTYIRDVLSPAHMMGSVGDTRDVPGWVAEKLASGGYIESSGKSRRATTKRNEGSDDGSTE